MVPDQKYLPPRVIAVDVDGTLIRNGKPVYPLISWLKEQRDKGFRLILWSARGHVHAENAINLFELQGIFDDVIGKPGYVIDDQGWDWIRYTHVIAKKF